MVKFLFSRSPLSAPLQPTLLLNLGHDRYVPFQKLSVSPSGEKEKKRKKKKKKKKEREREEEAKKVKVDKRLLK